MKLELTPITQDLFGKIRFEAKTHNPTFVVMKFEFDGVYLTEDLIKLILECLDYRTFCKKLEEL